MGSVACPQQCFCKGISYNAGKCPLCKFSELYTGMSQGAFGWGGGAVRLNLPAFTWIGNCSIFTDHYSFQFLKTMFSYLHAVRVGGEAWQLKLLIC